MWPQNTALERWVFVRFIYPNVVIRGYCFLRQWPHLCNCMVSSQFELHIKLPRVEKYETTLLRCRTEERNHNAVTKLYLQRFCIAYFYNISQCPCDQSLCMSISCSCNTGRFSKKHFYRVIWITLMSKTWNLLQTETRSDGKRPISRWGFSQRTCPDDSARLLLGTKVCCIVSVNCDCILIDEIIILHTLAPVI